MRTLFFGTPQFAVPSLDALAETTEVVGVVCQPDRPTGRGLVTAPPPVKARAVERGLTVVQPTKLRTGEFAAWVNAQQAELALVVAYGRILPRDVLESTAKGFVNVHASLLPKYRGAAPISWAVVRGEKETGVTLMLLDEGMDTGDMLDVARTPIGPDETAGALSERLAVLGAALVTAKLAAFARGELPRKAQDHAAATLAPPLEKKDGRVDWSAEARGIHDRVRGMSPWPGAYTRLSGKTVKLHATKLVELTRERAAAAGTVVVADKSRVLVACGAEGRDTIELTRVQLEGKKAVTATEWVSGRGIREGDVLGGTTCTNLRRRMSSPSPEPRAPGAPRPSDGSPGNFIEDRIAAEVAAKAGAAVRVHTRFPPEPNGFLHIGHAKSICLNFGLAKTFGGKCNLRFDDTNPETEETLFVQSIQEDVRWLGFEWNGETLYASDYFEQLYALAVKLVEDGKAYVDSRSLDDIRATRGDFYKPGEDSPHRTRSVAENKDLFARMRAGEFPDGAHVLRAKIDMKSEDVKLRDPVMYRIRRAHHHRTGDTWCIYPMYDWAHGQSDAIEGITHSICTLEFVNHRPLYHWFLDQLALPHHPEQIEFARLNLTYTVLSKRKLQELVAKHHVAGWDDPRMPTLAGLRRRGYTKEAIQAFCERVGVSTRDSVVDVTLLEHAVREDLNARSPRVMAVLHPLKVVIENLEPGVEEVFDAPYDPEKPEGPSRKLHLSREVWIEREDFEEVPPKKWFRLAPGQEVRLRYACLLRCTGVIKDERGEVVELRCTWDPASRGGTSPDGRKVKGTIHWVSVARAITAEVRLYDRLFTVENPLKGDAELLTHLNPKSIEVLPRCPMEPALEDAKPGARVQFERVGYFAVDPDSRPHHLVWNRTIGLRDSWAASHAKVDATSTIDDRKTPVGPGKGSGG